MTPPSAMQPDARQPHTIRPDDLHLTVAAYLNATGRAIPVDDDRASVIAGWDPDKTYWPRDITVAPPGAAAGTAAPADPAGTPDMPGAERWQYDQDDAMWVCVAPRP